MRGNYQYFVPVPQTAEELKKKYRELIFKHHPDQGGNTEDMKKVNAEHKKLFAKVGHIHTNSKGERYEKAPNETAEQFVEIMNTLIRFERVLIEICGSPLHINRRGLCGTANTTKHQKRRHNANTRFHKNPLKSDTLHRAFNHSPLWSNNRPNHNLNTRN